MNLPSPGVSHLVSLQRTLDPALLKDLEDSVSPNTWRAYRADLADYVVWIRHHEGDWNAPEVIAEYLRQLEASQAVYATIARRLTAIHKLLEIEALAKEESEFEDPTKHPKVTVTLQAIRRRLGTDQGSAAPLTAELLIQVLLAIDPDTTAGKRDIALLLIGWFGAFRRSELAGIRRHHLRALEQGIAIALPHSKTSQDKTVTVRVFGHPESRWDPITWLNTWVNHLDTKLSEPGSGIWLHVTKGDTITQPRPVGSDAINQILRRRFHAADLPTGAEKDTTEHDQHEEEDKTPPSFYSAHSLRAGFITEAKKRNVDEADIMRHTRHKSVQVMRGYDRVAADWKRNATADMGL